MRTWIVPLFALTVLGCGPQWPGDPEQPDPPGPPQPPPSDYVNLRPIVAQNPGLAVHSYYEGITSDDSAWFTEDRPTRYCVHADGDKRVLLSSSIAMAADVWKHYIDARGVVAALAAKAQAAGVDFKGLSHEFVQVDCVSGPDLIFEADADPSLDVMGLVNYQAYSIAYRERVSATWSRGRIWLSPLLFDIVYREQGLSLPFAILHELGHVLGNPDQSNTVMVPYYVQYIQFLTQLGFHHLSVDLTQSLYLGPANYTAGGYGPGADGDKALAYVFSAAHGHLPQGKVRARIDAGALWLKDDSGDPESSTAMTFDLEHARGSSLAPVFRAGPVHLDQKLELVPGVLKLPGGDLTLQITRNPAMVTGQSPCWSPLRLEFLDGSDYTPFFCANADDLSANP
jgi:hypothetical protein